MGAVKAIPDYPRGLTFEQVWAALMENREQIRETARETDRQMKESARRQEEATRQQEEAARQRREEIDKWLKESAQRQEETFRRMEATDERLAKQIGELGSRFGEAVEYMVIPNLVNKFRALGFVFTKAYPEASIKDEKNRILAEIDVTLENGDKVMIVEVKTKPNIRDIKDHIERMGTVRRHADLHGDKRKFLGSVAGMVVKDNVRDFALKSGFYVMEPSGDTFKIIKPEGEYKEREW